MSSGFGASRTLADAGDRQRMAPAVSTISRDSISGSRRGDKSGTVAALLSVGGTVVPLVAAVPLWSQADGPGGERLAARLLVGAGLMVGPSLGHFYAGCGSHGWRGIATRAAVAALSTGLAVAMTAGKSGFEDWNSAGAVLALGAGAVIGLGIYDMSTAPRCVRRQKEKLGAARFELVPRADRHGLHLAVEASF